jgi:coenzyme PQQ synthesis protein D (PqqD)
MSVSPSLSSRVRISEHTLFQELSGEAVLLELSRGVYFGLDEIGTRIWRLLGAGRSLQETVAALVDEYDVTEAQGAEDLLALVRELEERRLIELC